MTGSSSVLSNEAEEAMFYNVITSPPTLITTCPVEKKHCTMNKDDLALYVIGVQKATYYLTNYYQMVCTRFII